jgi:hypothetical protein
VNDEFKIILEGNVRVLILRYYPSIRLQGLRKTSKDLSRDRRSSGRDLKVETS